jgi:hypothetical protein
VVVGLPCIAMINSLHDNDDDVYLKKDNNEGVAKSNTTQKCRPAINKRVNIQTIMIVIKTVFADLQCCTVVI